MPRRTHEESMMYWGNVVREHQTSGQSIRAFCDQRGITQTLFYKWRKRLTETNGAEVDALVPVAVVNAPTKPTSSRIEIRVAQSVSVLVQPGFDVECFFQRYVQVIADIVDIDAAFAHQIQMDTERAAVDVTLRHVLRVVSSSNP